MRKTLIACIAVAVLAGGGTATAAKFITGKDVKNGSLTGADVKNGSLTGSEIKGGSVRLSDLSPGVQELIAKAGTPGKDGSNGAAGQNGAAGAKGDKGDKGDQGPALPADFSLSSTNADSDSGYDVTNPVTLTEGGLKFGPYKDGGAEGGSVRYDGANDMTLNDLTKLVYKASYTTDDDNDVAVPYLRVFVEDDTADVIFSPNTQTPKDTSEGVAHSWDVLAGTVRYDDDMGNGPESSWDDILEAHGNDVISGIKVSAGFTAGTNLRTLLSDLTVNGKAFHFGS
jgi:hypothetical protein